MGSFWGDLLSKQTPRVRTGKECQGRGGWTLYCRSWGRSSGYWITWWWGTNTSTATRPSVLMPGSQVFGHTAPRNHLPRLRPNPGLQQPRHAVRGALLQLDSSGYGWQRRSGETRGVVPSFSCLCRWWRTTEDKIIFSPALDQPASAIENPRKKPIKLIRS